VNGVGRARISANYNYVKTFLTYYAVNLTTTTVNDIPKLEKAIEELKKYEKQPAQNDARAQKIFTH